MLHVCAVWDLSIWQNILVNMLVFLPWLPSQDPLAALLCILATRQPPLSTRSSEERLSMIAGFHLWTYHRRAKEALIS